jgi:calmodulin
MAQKQYTEKDDLMEAFYHFDQDQDGYLTIDELRHILTNLGNPMNQNDIEDFLREANDGSGRVNYANIVEMIYSSVSS